MTTANQAPGGDDDLLFPEEDDPRVPAQPRPRPPSMFPRPSRPLPRWRVLVVDDDESVHRVTTLALANLVVDGFALHLDHAYDGAQARQMLEDQEDYGLVLLDVVMASDDDGLRLARWIRDELRNGLIRIVLRTGQAGCAPELQVMLGYDINDFQPKAELTAQRLVTAVVAAIRAYRDLRTVAEQKAGLEKIIGATATLFDRGAVSSFTAGVLQQLAALASPHESAMFFQGPREAFKPEEPHDLILAATGRFARHVGQRASSVLDPVRIEQLRRSLREATSTQGEGYAVFSLAPKIGSQAVQAGIYIEGWGELDDWRKRLLELFCANAAVAFENQRLHHEQSRMLEAVSRFVPKRMLEALGRKDLAELGLGDLIQREMTVLFLDIRGFTPLAERLGPRETFALLNRAFGELVPCIHDAGGMIDKYLGDGFLALFPDEPVAAVRAALAMLGRLDDLDGRPREEGGLGESIDLGIGIHRGQTALGLVGAQDRMETTVISDTVNVAARLEQLTRRYGARIVVSETVFSALPKSLSLEARSLGPQRVRGKVQAVSCFDLVMGDRPELRAHKVATQGLYAEASRCYDEGLWSQAAQRFQAIAEKYPLDWGARAHAEECHRRASGWFDKPG